MFKRVVGLAAIVSLFGACAACAATSERILAGRYWLGGTDQGLEIQGRRYRYYSEGGEQPWQSLHNLKSVNPGVVSDGSNYWCLSTMAPKTGATACTKDGWATAAKPPAPDRALLFSCATENGKQIQLYKTNTTIDYTFGRPNELAELDLQVPHDQATNSQWSGFGRTMIYAVTVPRGDTHYRVFWKLDKLDKTHTPEAGVEVQVNQKSIATVNCHGEIVNNLKGVDLKPTRG